MIKIMKHGMIKIMKHGQVPKLKINRRLKRKEENRKRMNQILEQKVDKQHTNIPQNQQHFRVVNTSTKQ